MDLLKKTSNKILFGLLAFGLALTFIMLLAIRLFG